MRPIAFLALVLGAGVAAADDTPKVTAPPESFFDKFRPTERDAARKVRIRCKEIEHSGVAGLQVQEVLGTNQIVSSEFIGSGDNWIGQWLTVVADASDGAVPLWNFTVTAFDPATGKLTETSALPL